MIKKRLPIVLLIGFMSLNLFQSCKDEESTDDPTPVEQEFVADDNSFADFRTWALDAEESGVDPALGPAHAGNDSTSVRKIYFKDGQGLVDGAYPKGTIIVKETSNSAGFIMNTAMVKRGAGFNSDNDGWEWFILNEDGTIGDDNGTPRRGAKLNNGGCAGCHANATNDWVFSK